MAAVKKIIKERLKKNSPLPFSDSGIKEISTSIIIMSFWYCFLICFVKTSIKTAMPATTIIVFRMFIKRFE
ncbi:unnamed protein product [marine sediment metagenome]|uniref:Uncharacterized protein n=1 Tax=marine sediment metagenome TaxID=412755 RepID=X0ZHH6_9ZZZZ